MKQQAVAPLATTGTPARLTALACFALLGGLAAGRPQDTTTIALSAFAGAALGGLAMVVVGWVLALFLPRAGRQVVVTAVARGFLLLVPFTVLALAAEGVLHWQAAGALASAGIMTGSSAIGAELSGPSGRRVGAILLPSLCGMAVASTWITAITWLVQAGGGG